MGIIKEIFTEKLIFAVILLVVAAMIFVFTAQEDKNVLKINPEAETVAAVPADHSEISVLEKRLEEKIAANLESIKGVGKTKVLVTYNSSLIKEYARDESITKRTSKETDKEGGTRETEEVNESNRLVIAGNTSPILVVEQRPEVAGVLVIAQGASDPKIKEQIFESVRTLLNIPPSKISVAALGGV